VKLVDLGTRLNDARYASPRQILEESLEAIGKEGAFESGKKCLIICLDDTDDNYWVSTKNAGLKCSEIIALCEHVKDTMMSEIKGRD